ncbi:unnamed protein product [Rhizophagus irregularis]|nr:unnamed protein product [Rhizophagus irregularis]
MLRHTQRILPTVRQSIRKCSTISSSVGVLYGLSTWQADYTSNRPIHEKLEELDEKISKLEEKNKNKALFFIKLAYTLIESIFTI